MRQLANFLLQCFNAEKIAIFAKGKKATY